MKSSGEMYSNIIDNPKSIGAFQGHELQISQQEITWCNSTLQVSRIWLHSPIPDMSLQVVVIVLLSIITLKGNYSIPRGEVGV